MKRVKGYKVFEPDWTCRGFQFEVGQIYKEDVKPEVCRRGFHFCEKASDCFNYYQFDPNNKVAEVIALGKVDSDGTKSCTNKIQIVREIPWDEVLRIVNTGYCNTGHRNTGNCNTGHWNTGHKNTGNCNTGHWNTGDRNTGDWNTGHWNTGHRNTGHRNTGNCNTGDWNTGDRNTGYRNTGNRNTGDWNVSSYNTGCFMTEEPKIYLFNKPSDITYRDWRECEACNLLNQIPKNVVEWVYSRHMTDEEKTAYPTHETTGGYLKVLDESECSRRWWDGLSDEEKTVIRNIPNFDSAIFKKCTGIDVDRVPGTEEDGSEE